MSSTIIPQYRYARIYLQEVGVFPGLKDTQESGKRCFGGGGGDRGNVPYRPTGLIIPFDLSGFMCYHGNRMLSLTTQLIH